MAVSIHVAGVQGKETSVDKERCLADLATLAKQVGLVDWTISPRSLSQKQRELFSQARLETLKICSFDNLATRSVGFAFLQRLFELDPLSEETASGLEKALEQLSELVEQGHRFTSTEQEALIAAYASGMEALISHIEQKNIRGISAATKAFFLKAPDLLKSLNKGSRDRKFELDIQRALEGAKRLVSDEKPTPLLSVALRVTKVAASLFAEDIQGAWEEALKLFNEAKTKFEARQRSWYEAVCLLRRLSRQAVYEGSSAQVIERIQQFIFEQSSAKRGLMKNCAWQVFVEAASCYEHILLHSQGKEAQRAYQKALSSDPTQPGLLALSSLRKVKNANNYSKVEEGVVAAVRRVIASLKRVQLNSETEGIFQKGLLATVVSLKGADLKQELERDLEKFTTLREVWKNETAALETSLEKQIQVLQEERATLLSKSELTPEGKEAQEAEPAQETLYRQEELALLEEELGELGKEKERLDMISRDLSLALGLQQEEDRLAKLKNIVSSQEVAQAALETQRQKKEISEALQAQAVEDDYDMFGLLMTDPVITPSGYTYSKEGIIQWITNNGTDPMTRAPLEIADLKENKAVKERIGQKQKIQTLQARRPFLAETFAVHPQLFHAVKRSDFLGLCAAIRKGGHPTFYKEEGTGDTALHLAAAKESLEFFQQLLFLTDSNSLRIKNKKGETPLSIAIGRGFAYMEAIVQAHPTISLEGCNRLFHEAISNGSMKEVQFFLDHGQDVNELLNKVAPLARAVNQGHLEIATFLIHSGAKVSSGGLQEVLHDAVELDELDKVEFLLDQGMSPNDELKGRVLLARAVEQDWLKVADFLVARGAKVYTSYGHVQPGVLEVFHDAVEKGKIERVQFLIDQGLNSNIPLKGRSPLVRAVIKGDLEMAAFLVSRGAKVSSEGGELEAFYQAIESGKRDKIEFLLKNKIDLDAKLWRKSPIAQAVESGHLDIATLLLSSGATLSLEGGILEILHYGAKNGEYDKVTFLLERGIDPNALDGGISLLIRALEKNDFKMATLLIEHGTLIDMILPSLGRNALHQAIVDKDLDRIRFLLGKNASKEIEDSQGNMPLHLAASKGMEEIIPLLITSRVINAEGALKRTPLLQAAASEEGSFETSRAICVYLIGQGASLDATDKEGSTSLHLAAAIGNRSLVKELCLRGLKPNVFNTKGDIASFIAAKNGHFDVACDLVDQDPSIREKVIQNAIERRDVDALKKLAEKSPFSEKERQKFVTLGCSLGAATVVNWLLDAKLNPFEWLLVFNDLLFKTLGKQGKEYEETALVLLKRGARADGRNEDSDTVMHVALRGGHFGLIEPLCNQYKIDCSLRGKEGPITLAEFALKLTDAQLEILLKSGVDPNRQDKEGNTALHLAASKGFDKKSSLLLKYRANPDIQNHKGQTAMHLVTSSGPELLAIIPVLLVGKPNLNLKDRDNRSAFYNLLNRYTGSKIPEYLEGFLKGGADPNTRCPDEKGRVLTEVALGVVNGRKESIEILELLLKFKADATYSDYAPVFQITNAHRKRRQKEEDPLPPFSEMEKKAISILIKHNAYLSVKSFPEVGDLIEVQRQAGGVRNAAYNRLRLYNPGKSLESLDSEPDVIKAEQKVEKAAEKAKVYLDLFGITPDSLGTFIRNRCSK